MDRGYQQVNILFYVLVVLCIVEFIYIIISKISVSKFYKDLNNLFDDAIKGIPVTINYDESVLSALYDTILHYIEVNQSKLQTAKNEKESMQMIISNVSHQIGQPVSDICLYTELLTEKGTLDEETQILLNDLRRQSDKLRFIFDVMLKSSRLESGIITINNIQKQSIRDLISAIISELINSITAKNIDIEVDIAEDETAIFDFNWTKEAIYNIIENGIKYTPQNGRINIKAVRYEIYVCLEISDTGIGIPKNEYNDIFKRFYRSDSVKGYSGLGIGLYLTRKILLKENGYIKVSSVLGKGSTFSVYLPC